MKIALCIAGQPRKVARTFTGVKKYLLDKHDVDVFAHFWTGGTWDVKVHEGYESSGSLQFDKINGLDHFFKLYDPRVVQVQDQMNGHNGKPWFTLSYPRTFFSMFYSIDTAISLTNKFAGLPKYDLIVKYRTDLDLRDDLFQHEIEEHKLYSIAFPKGFETLGGDNPGVNDLMFYGTPWMMRKLAMGTYVESMSAKYYDDCLKTPQCGEVMFGRHLRNNDVKYEHVRYNGGLVR